MDELKQALWLWPPAKKPVLSCWLYGANPAILVLPGHLVVTPSDQTLKAPGIDALMPPDALFVCVQVVRQLRAVS